MEKPAAPATQEEVFAAKHAELLREARDAARELGATVRVVAFRPGDDGTTVTHEFAAGGVSRVREAVTRDVSAMGPREVAAHRRRLLELRAAVERELRARWAPGQQETDGQDGAGAGSERIGTVD